MDRAPPELQSHGFCDARLYNQVRTHLSLDKDAPEFRQAQSVGNIVALPLLA
jgi:hypothetical protein